MHRCWILWLEAQLWLQWQEENKNKSTISLWTVSASQKKKTSELVNQHSHHKNKKKSIIPLWTFNASQRIPASDGQQPFSSVISTCTYKIDALRPSQGCMYREYICLPAPKCICSSMQLTSLREFMKFHLTASSPSHGVSVLLGYPLKCTCKKFLKINAKKWRWITKYLKGIQHYKIGDSIWTYKHTSNKLMSLKLILLV